MNKKETPQIEDTKQEAPETPSVAKTSDPKSEPQYDPAELLAIFDSILFEGRYTEDVLIKGKLKVTFRSRSASETSEITKEIDGQQFNLISALQERRAFLNLVYSLERYNGQNIGGAKIEERKKFIGDLPAVVVAALSEALYKFDAKTDAACREGEENF